MKMKENLVFAEAFSFIFKKIIWSMSVKWVHLFLIIKKYQSGSQQAFLIVQIIIV